MQTITLYKYTRADGGITISPKKPDWECEYTEMYRLVADEGKALTQDGDNTFPCVDVKSTDGWYEVEVNEDGEIVTTDEEEDSV